MKNDIDFDELDKAVTSLMGAVPSDKQPENTDEEEQKTLAITPTLQPDEAPTYNKLGEVAKQIGSETLASNDEPTVITKTLQTTEEQESTPLPVVPQPPLSSQSAPIQERTRTPIVPRPSSGRYMDVVSPSVASRPQPAPAVTPVTTPSPASVPQDTPGQPMIPDTSPVPLTPFLPDAKVEKRPLGVGTPDVETMSFEASDLSLPVTEPAREVEVEPEVQITQPEDAEAKHDLQGDQPVLNAADFVAQSSEEKKLQEIESIATDRLSPDMHESIRKVESSDTEKMIADAGQPVTSGAAGAIYDVNEYHQPLEQPSKQKSGWGVVIIIVIIIGLAAVLGGGAYVVLNLGA